MKEFTVDKAIPHNDVVAIFAKEKIDTVLLGVDGLGREGSALIRADADSRWYRNRSGIQ